jgi:hypothetical protein
MALLFCPNRHSRKSWTGSSSFLYYFIRRKGILSIASSRSKPSAPILIRCDTCRICQHLYTNILSHIRLYHAVSLISVQRLCQIKSSLWLFSYTIVTIIIISIIAHTSCTPIFLGLVGNVTGNGKLIPSERDIEPMKLHEVKSGESCEL